MYANDRCPETSEKGIAVYSCAHPGQTKPGRSLYICITLGQLVRSDDGSNASHRVRGRAISRGGAE